MSSFPQSQAIPQATLASTDANKSNYGYEIKRLGQPDIYKIFPTNIRFK